jgi:hypothetical protein
MQHVPTDCCLSDFHACQLGFEIHFIRAPHTAGRGQGRALLPPAPPPLVTGKCAAGRCAAWGGGQSEGVMRTARAAVSRRRRRPGSEHCP